MGGLTGSALSGPVIGPPIPGGLLPPRPLVTGRGWAARRVIHAAARPRLRPLAVPHVIAPDGEPPEGIRAMSPSRASPLRPGPTWPTRLLIAAYPTPLRETGRPLLVAGRSSSSVGAELETPMAGPIRAAASLTPTPSPPLHVLRDTAGDGLCRPSPPSRETADTLCPVPRP